MSKRKGLSFEEKTEKLLELFHDDKDVFTLKVLEPLAQKRKGIVSKTVKDVLQGLLSDGLVEGDKIGTGQYYWSFPSQAALVQKRAIDKLEADIAGARESQRIAAEAIEAAKTGREDTSERRALLEEYEALRSKRARLAEEIKLYADQDPEILDAIQDDTKIAFDAANRWTDNIFNIKSWATRKFGMSSTDFHKSFVVPAELDYVTEE